MEQICVDQKIPVLGSYDIIVAAAALQALRRRCPASGAEKRLLLEKSVILGGWRRWA
jgi:hypothetical protein